MTPVVTMYTKRRCLYCALAKRVFRRLGVAVREVDLDDNPDLRGRISSEAGNRTTVPVVFIGDRFIGGYKEVRAMHQTRTLQELLRSAAQGRNPASLPPAPGPPSVAGRPGA
jgi:glutaredoxin 3